MRGLNVSGTRSYAVVVDFDDLVLDVDDQAHSLVADSGRSRAPTAASGLRAARPRRRRASIAVTIWPRRLSRPSDAGVGEGDRCELLVAEDLLDALDVDADEQPADAGTCSTRRGITRPVRPGVGRRALRCRAAPSRGRRSPARCAAAPARRDAQGRTARHDVVDALHDQSRPDRPTSGRRSSGSVARRLRRAGRSPPARRSGSEFASCMSGRIVSAYSHDVDRAAALHAPAGEALERRTAVRATASWLAAGHGREQQARLAAARPGASTARSSLARSETRPPAAARPSRSRISAGRPSERIVTPANMGIERVAWVSGLTTASTVSPTASTTIPKRLPSISTTTIVSVGRRRRSRHPEVLVPASTSGSSRPRSRWTRAPSTSSTELRDRIRLELHHFAARGPEEAHSARRPTRPAPRAGSPASAGR